MDLISTVLGIFSWAAGSTDRRLTLDLNSVFIRVDLPRPLCPVSVNTTVSECESKRHTHTHAKAVTGCRYRSAQTLGAAAQTRRCRDRLAAVKRLQKICDVPAGAASLCGADRKKKTKSAHTSLCLDDLIGRVGNARHLGGSGLAPLGEARGGWGRSFGRWDVGGSSAGCVNKESCGDLPTAKHRLIASTFT